MKRFFLIILLLFTLINIYANDINVELSCETDQVQVGQIFQITVNISSNSRQIGKITSFNILGTSNFQVTGQSEGTSVSIVNGKVTSTKTRRLTLYPAKVGNFVIGPVQVKINNKLYKSNTINIKVVKSLTHSNSKKESNKQQDNRIFLKAIPEKNTCFVNEPVHVTFKLFTRIPVNNFNFKDLPKAKDFWIENIEKKDNRIKQYYKIINHKRYLVAELKDIIVFPTRAGKLTLTPLSINCEVRVQNSDPFFDDFFSSPFFEQTKTITLNSNSIIFNVKPLPIDNKPQNFSDVNVGSFDIKATVNKTQVKQNEGVTFKLIISGMGNIKMIGEPEINFPSNFNVYKSNSNIKSKIENGKIYGEKIIEYALIPENPGKFTIKPIKFNFFDLNEKRYKTIQTKPIIITVKKSNKSLAFSNNLTQNEINILNEDIKYIKPDKFATINIPQQIPSYLIIIYLILSLVFIPIAYIHSKHLKKLHMDINYARAFSAGKISKKRLKRAKELLNTDNIDDYYNELYKAIVGFICDKLAIPAKDLNTNDIKQILLNKNLEEEQINQIIDFLNKCQMARFLPTKPEDKQKHEDFESAKQILDNINKILK